MSRADKAGDTSTVSVHANGLTILCPGHGTTGTKRRQQSAALGYAKIAPALSDHAT